MKKLDLEHSELTFIDDGKDEITLMESAIIVEILEKLTSAQEKEFDERMAKQNMELVRHKNGKVRYDEKIPPASASLVNVLCLRTSISASASL